MREPRTLALTIKLAVEASCPRCGQTMIADAAVCGACRDHDRAPQGETMTLFNAPRPLAPPQMEGLF